MADIINDSNMQNNINSQEAVTQNSELTVEEKVDSLLTDVSEIKEILMSNGVYTEEETEAVTEQKWTKEDLDFASQDHDPFSSEALENAGSYGLPFTLFGFSVVFCVLAIIMVIISVFGKIFGVAQPKQKPVQQPKKPEPKKQQNSMAEKAPAAVPAAPVSDDKGIVAAIMAAISSFRAANGENGGFRVVSFKKRK